MRGRTIIRRAASERGLTLIEISVSLLLIGILMAMVIPSVSNITRVDLRTSARKVAGTIRYTYDLAARKNTPFRVVFDLDNRAWWIESASDRFLLGREKTEVTDGALVEDQDEERKQRFVKRTFIEGGEMWKPKQKATFSNFAGPLTPKATLPDTIAFQDVWIAHQTERVTAGLAYLYCFPTGMTERAVIHLVDEDDNAYTLWVHALTGRVKIMPQYIEAPDE
jgi:prepilin-type N-terminal cleavage/methylation domain-containing protein